MFQFSILVIIIVAYCFYHIYTHGNPRYWYIFIILFPFLGALAYFIFHIYNVRAKDESVPGQEFQNPRVLSKINVLEEQVEIADTVSNKIALADAYMERSEYAKAVEMYRSCLNRLTEDDEELNKKLITAYYSNNDFLNTIQLGEKLNRHRFFQNSVEKTYFAWAYFELHDDNKAESIFKELNIPNTNYYHRKEYAKFLIEIDRHKEAQVIIDETLSEIEQMDAYERKIVKERMKEIELIKSKIKIV